MRNNMSDEIKNEITLEIEEILNEKYGFEIYIATKNGEPKIKKFILEEGNPNNNNGFKQRICNSIEETIRSKYLTEESQFIRGEELANEQNRFYVIEQNETYYPFDYLSNLDNVEMENFNMEDKDNADAILFKFTFQRDGKLNRLWAYQKILPTSIPNKKKQHFQLIAKSKQHPEIFKEMTDQMFVITRKVNLLIVSNKIVTNEIGFMERHFQLEKFIRASANEAALLVASVGIVNNEDKLKEYVSRPNKKYAKKMMQIHKYPVATMTKDELMNKISTVKRWENVFDIRKNQIYLRTFKDVENIIDLFVERYTRSDVTGQEYDTDVKDKARPIML